MPSSSWSVTGVQTCARSEEHTSELQSLTNLVCRLLIEEKKELPKDTLNEQVETQYFKFDSLNLESREILSPVTIAYESYFFFFNDTATTEIYTLALHDALPI